jgi:hypothetical protein
MDRRGKGIMIRWTKKGSGGKKEMKKGRRQRYDTYKGKVGRSDG